VHLVGIIYQNIICNCYVIMLFPSQHIIGTIRRKFQRSNTSLLILYNTMAEPTSAAVRRLDILSFVRRVRLNWIVHVKRIIFYFLLWRCDPTRVMASSFLRFLDHTQRRTTVGRSPLDEWSARRRDLYLTTHNTHNRQISMPTVGFEPTISAGERPQTYALDRVVTGTG